MKLCTFEVATPLGRHSRVGLYTDGRIIDVNFATAWRQAEKGQPDSNRLADALAPSNMLDFLRAGHRAMHAAERATAVLQEETGNEYPAGPNGETLVYNAGEVRLRAPLPNPASLRDFSRYRYMAFLSAVYVNFVP